jgi:hypothetical protein
LPCSLWQEQEEIDHQEKALADFKAQMKRL